MSYWKNKFGELLRNGIKELADMGRHLIPFIIFALIGNYLSVSLKIWWLIILFSIMGFIATLIYDDYKKWKGIE